MVFYNKYFFVNLSLYYSTTGKKLIAESQIYFLFKRYFTASVLYKSVLLLIIHFIMFLGTLPAQTKIYKTGEIDLQCTMSYMSAKDYYDLEEHVKTSVPFDIMPTNTTSKNYTFTLDHYTFGTKIFFGISENVSAFAEFPLRYSTLIEEYDVQVRYIDDTGDTSLTTQKYQAGNYSLFQMPYFALGCNYFLNQKRNYTALHLEIRLPLGTHNGTQNDPGYPFLSDGTLEVISGFITGIKYKKSFFETSLYYDYRAEDLADLMLIHTEYGFSSVERTIIGVFLDFKQPFGSYKYAVPVNPRKITPKETLVSFGAKFSLGITEHINTFFSYNLNLIGKNSINTSAFNITMGYLF